MDLTFPLLLSLLTFQLVLFIVGLAIRWYGEIKKRTRTTVLDKFIFSVSALCGSLCVVSIGIVFVRGFEIDKYLIYLLLFSSAFVILHFRLIIARRKPHH